MFVFFLCMCMHSIACVCQTVMTTLLVNVKCDNCSCLLGQGASTGCCVAKGEAVIVILCVMVSA